MPASNVENRAHADGTGGRYELVVDGVTAIAEYRLSGNRINFHHTVVPPELGGKGVGGRLVNAALDDAEAKGLEIEADCWFVAKALERRTAART